MKGTKIHCRRCKHTFVSVDKYVGCLVCGSISIVVKGEKHEDDKIVRSWYKKIINRDKGE